MDCFQGNRILRALSSCDSDLLRPALTSVELHRGRVLEVVGVATEQAFFIETGLAAVIARSPGREIGIGVVGNDGMTGLDLLFGTGLAANQTLVQSTGMAVCIGTADLQQAMRRSATLSALLLRYTHVFMVQASQTALTNGHASIEERLARWILLSHDRFSGNDLAVTHEFIALMVGVRRQGITEALHLLEGRHFIESTREKPHVVDRPGLIELASGSYGVCEAEHERLIDGQFRRPLVAA